MSQAGETLTLVDLIDRLVEVPEPPPVSMMPQTWGWFVLGGLLLVGLGCLVFVLLRRYRNNAYRRAALAELEDAGDDAVVIARVLRRTALSAYPRQEVGHLSGQVWLEFLDSKSKGTEFTNGPGRCLALAPYRQVDPAPGLGQLAQRWVRTHQAGTQA